MPLVGAKYIVLIVSYHYPLVLLHIDSVLFVSLHASYPKQLNIVEPVFYRFEGTKKKWCKLWGNINSSKWRMHAKNIWKHVKYTNNLTELVSYKVCYHFISCIHRMNWWFAYLILIIPTSYIRVPNLAGYMWNSEKASVLCKQMLAIYHEDLVAQGYI
jgi:hypothetical protein